MDTRKVSDLLRSLSLDELIAECAEASAAPAIDLKGCVALLEEATRRAELGELETSRFEVVKAALDPCSKYPADEIFVLLMDRHPWDRHRQALQKMVGEPPLRFLYHGTLRSRLGSIAREGLVPAKRRKRYWSGPGLAEHAASGVFFETQWRNATRWVGAAAYEDTKEPTKGAIIRIDSSKLKVEKDIRSEGAVVVRQDLIPVDSAYVLLFPFSTTHAWVPIAEAVEIVKQTRKRT